MRGRELDRIDQLVERLTVIEVEFENPEANLLLEYGSEVRP